MTLHPTTEETYGESVRRRRLEAGLTQDELAEAAGCYGPESGATISRIERGARIPRLRTRFALETALKAALQLQTPAYSQREQRLLRIAEGVIRVHRQMIIERRIAPAGWMQLVSDAQRELKRVQRDNAMPKLKVVDGS